MQRWILWVGASLVGLALALWLTRDEGVLGPESSLRASTGESTQAPNESAAPPASVPSEGFDFSVRLSSYEGRSARADSVRIGIATVEPDQARAHDRWLSSGSEGGGPADYSELATLEHWLNPPAGGQPNGDVAVGPVRLPPADRYDLEATSDDPLLYYRASFTSSTAPKVIEPIFAAGLRLMREPLADARVGVLLRRVEDASIDPLWSAIQAEIAPPWLAAYDDESWPLDPGAMLAPLPPGPIDLILTVNGIEAERRRIDLFAGRWTDVRFDSVAQAVAQAISTTLELNLVVAGTATPIDNVAVTLFADGRDQIQHSSNFGVVRFEGVDRQRTQRVSLQFPRTVDELPEWPESMALEIDPDDSVSANDPVWHKTIEVTPLNWLILRSTDLRIPFHRQGGDPYPIFVLQQLTDSGWIDVSSDHFLPVPEGVAVSVTRDGQHRVMAMRSPWSVYYSTVADTSPSGRSRYPVDLLSSAGTRMDIKVVREGVPMANVPVALRGPASSLPMLTRTTDASGQFTLDQVTVEVIRIEVPGYLTATVESHAGEAVVELSVDHEADSTATD